METGIWNSLLIGRQDHHPHRQAQMERTLLILGGTPAHHSDVIQTLYDTQIEAAMREIGTTRMPFSTSASIPTNKDSDKLILPPNTLPMHGYTFIKLSSTHNSKLLLNIHTFPGSLKHHYTHYLKDLLHRDDITVMILIDSSKIELYNNKVFESTVDQIKPWVAFIKEHQQISTNTSPQNFLGFASHYNRDVESMKSSDECDDPLPYNSLFVVMNSANLDYKITKSHLIDELQQTLRTIALSSCSSLFYFNHQKTHKNSNRLLTTHLINGLQIDMDDIDLLDASFEDPVSIPLGWDSWGKIKTLDENFDCARVLDVWKATITAESKILPDLTTSITPTPNTTTVRASDHKDELKLIYEGALKKMFQAQQTRAATS